LPAARAGLVREALAAREAGATGEADAQLDQEAASAFNAAPEEGSGEGAGEQRQSAVAVAAARP